MFDSVNHQRICFDNGAKTYFRGAGTTASPNLDSFIFRNGQAGNDLLNINGSANISSLEKLTITSDLIVNGNIVCGTRYLTLSTKFNLLVLQQHIVPHSILIIVLT